MSSERIRLRSGASLDVALDALRPLLIEANNVNGAGPGRVQDAYVAWVDAVERQLIGVTREPAFISAFHTERFWRIRDADPRARGLWDLVSAEQRMQVERLRTAIEDLEERARRSRGAPGHVAVVDTNVLLEFEPPAQVPWPAILEVDRVRLVVPLRVVEELDAKKYGKSLRLQKRSRSLLPWLEAVIEPSGRPAHLRDGVTIEVPLEAEDRSRPADADAEVIDTCLTMRQLTEGPVTLITADTSVLLRARAVGLDARHPPERYRRSNE